MSASCPTESIGLPIGLSGSISQAQFNSMKTTSSIELNSSPRTTFPSYNQGFIFDESSSTSIRLNGEIYSLKFVKIFNRFHSVQYFKDGSPPIAEMALWYQTSNKKNLLTCIPIYTATTNNDGGKYIEAALNKSTDYRGSIGDIYIRTSSSLQYVACIQYAALGTLVTSTNQLPTLSITCIVFNEGINISAPVNTAFTNARAGSNRLEDFGVPYFILPDINLRTVQGAPPTPIAGPGGPRWPAPVYDSSTGNNRRVYSVNLSTGLDTFTNRFRYYNPTIIVSAQQKKKDASAYKCIPINTKKDLVMLNGKLVVNISDDEVTGAGSLSDIVEEQKNPDEQKGTNIASYVAIAIGGTAGIALASGFLWLGFRLIIRR